MRWLARFADPIGDTENTELAKAMASTAARRSQIAYNSEGESRLESFEQSGFRRGKLGITNYTAVPELG
jgi:hypothetical protein